MLGNYKRLFVISLGVFWVLFWVFFWFWFVFVFKINKLRKGLAKPHIGSALLGYAWGLVQQKKIALCNIK